MDFKLGFCKHDKWLKYRAFQGKDCTNQRICKKRQTRMCKIITENKCCMFGVHFAYYHPFLNEKLSVNKEKNHLN